MTKTNDILLAKRKASSRGFSLIEIVTVMVISSMVMISALAIFNRVKSATISVNEKLDQEDAADEILQRIAEDLDRLASVGFDTTVTIKNRMSGGFNKSQLIIENKFYDKNNRPQTFEKVIWQSEYDALEDMTILYRHHGGLSLEDKILDGDLAEKQTGKTALFVPVSWNMTLFEIVVPKKDADPLMQWSGKELPTSIAVAISFAEPVENFDGTLEVPEEDIIIRHVAVNRTRMQAFKFEKKNFTKPELDAEDPNDVDADADEGADDGQGDQTDDQTDDKDSNNSPGDNKFNNPIGGNGNPGSKAGSNKR